jgi:hypothetical protein
MPETESDSWTRLEMSASDSWVVFAILRRSFPTLRVRYAKSGISANANSASCQLRSNMPTIVATTVVALEAIDVAVLVTTFCTPPMSFEMRDCTSPVRVRVKNASERRCRCRKTAVRRSCITRWPTWFESSVWSTPSTTDHDRDRDDRRRVERELARVVDADRLEDALEQERGQDSRAAVKTISARTPVSLSLYGANRRPMWRRFERRTAGSEGRSGNLGGSVEEHCP